MVGPVEAALNEADVDMIADDRRRFPAGTKAVESKETEKDYGDDYDTPLSSIGHVVMSNGGLSTIRIVVQDAPREL